MLRWPTHMLLPASPLRDGNINGPSNWLGNHAWTNALVWKGQAAYSVAQNKSWSVDGNSAGTFKAASGLTFLKVDNAGHMVPRDQPANSLNMILHHLRNTPLGEPL